MEFVALNKSIAKIQANADVRAYLAAVAQDPQNETIDYDMTKEPVEAASMCADDAITARLTLITNLNNIFFVLLSLHISAKNEVVVNTWLWENHTRLNKMIAVAMVLEGNNLRTFNASPRLMDTPQALVYLNMWILNAKPSFEKLAALHTEALKEHGSDAFYALYIGTSNA